jgi:hypothetical protein
LGDDDVGPQWEVRSVLLEGSYRQDETRVASDVARHLDPRDVVE